jgi:hypothetical protein
MLVDVTREDRGREPLPCLVSPIAELSPAKFAVP